ncbi:aminotransferase class I/II-fold pyridoxal phosphate-dependent enzyme [Radiobacillus sp. PE A8.2]|uniref:aminotransferase class I/II-fold pyridoxal phosphate-dependent enzyme n=1 Tax=Radiobacillus sp. PE A8.2 TaxID=3380349 RepID=UPI00388DED0F
MKQQSVAPLYEVLTSFASSKPVSFHVPGHKSGTIFPELGRDVYKDVLSIDVTELTGLDDLHAAEGVIEQAQQLAADYFGSDQTFFLVGGSTVGNLAMILATCSAGDKVIVQRNCHKSIMHGLELSGVQPIFVAPVYDDSLGRYTAPDIEGVVQALAENRDSKALILTYPDYFGRTYPIKTLITNAHEYGIPVLVDEAHAVHFSISEDFPTSSLELGADVVVQSAHKMAPAMTMASFLHSKSSLVSSTQLAYYLQMLQSSSPSYPILASLDLTRYFLVNLSSEEVVKIIDSASQLRRSLERSTNWSVVPFISGLDDPLKVTIEAHQGTNGHQLAKLFERYGIYPELSTHKQVLFIHGLSTFDDWKHWNNALEHINDQLKLSTYHDTIEEVNVEQEPIVALHFSYQEMKNKARQFLIWNDVLGHVAAEAIVPYPPGIPVVLKGEKITSRHIKVIKYLVTQGTNFQNKNIEQGTKVFV